jgi:hypothetical protein
MHYNSQFYLDYLHDFVLLVELIPQKVNDPDPVLLLSRVQVVDIEMYHLVYQDVWQPDLDFLQTSYVDDYPQEDNEDMDEVY